MRAKKLPVDLRQKVRDFCAQLTQLQWMPLVEPPLSATLHAQLRAALTTRCAKRFEARQLSRLLGWLQWRQRLAP